MLKIRHLQAILNENFLKYFPDVNIPEEMNRSGRSPYLNIGPYVVLQKMIRESEIRELLAAHIDDKDADFALDLAVYSIISENNAGQYYPDYAYSHPLGSLTPQMSTNAL